MGDSLFADLVDAKRKFYQVTFGQGLPLCYLLSFLLYISFIYKCLSNSFVRCKFHCTIPGEFGWTTAAVTPEIGWEIELQRKTEFVIAERAIEILLNSLRLYQRSLGTGLRSKDELEVMDKMERIVSSWRDEQTRLLGNPFGSVFRARYTPSLFAHSLRRYCDLYMSNVGSLRHYSPQHRFYPESPKLLSHEIRGSNPECCDVDDSKFDINC